MHCDCFCLNQEFFEKFRILLPKGATGKQEDITELFERMEMNNTTYQIGKSQVNVFYLICNLFCDSLSVYAAFQRMSWLETLHRVITAHTKDSVMCFELKASNK